MEKATTPSIYCKTKTPRLKKMVFGVVLCLFGVDDLKFISQYVCYFCYFFFFFEAMVLDKG